MSQPFKPTLAPDTPPDGAELLTELREALTRFVIFPDEQAADAVTLWIAATHAQPAWEHAPRLVITAPEKRCGKSRLLDIIEVTSYQPLIAVNASIAAVTRSIGADPPTLLIDETDSIFGPKASANNEELRGILNAGHQRNRPSIRYNVNTQKNEELATFAMAALAGIGDMPDTIMDRAVIIRMQRRAPGETVQPYRTRRDRPALEQLSQQLTEWAREREEQLADTEPHMPLDDRAADTWEPLVIIADNAGGDWPDRARKAATGQVKAAEDDETESSLSMRLLSDLRDIFGESDGLYTASIITQLCAIEEAPWSDLYGKPIDARRLSKMLGKYGVKPGDVREADTEEKKNLKGYKREDLWPVWQRYLSPPRDKRDTGDIAGQARRGQNHVADESATGDKSATGMTSDVAAVADVADMRHQTDECCKNGPLTPQCQICPSSPNYRKNVS